MERTLEQLKEQSSNAQRHPLLVNAVNNSNSAQEAENKVAEFEFPTPLLRETRLLWKIKKDHPAAFEAIKQQVPEQQTTDSGTIIFSCSYKSMFSDDQCGSLIVKPHPILPPTFWDYTLLDEDEDPVYSSRGVGKKYNTHSNDFKKRTECVLAHGSCSLPASLRVRFENGLRGTETEFEVTEKEVGTYPASTNTFRWTRHVDTEPGQSQEWYERTRSNSNYGIDSERVVFKKLGKDEANTFREYDNHPDFKGEFWVLILISDVETSHSVQFVVTTIYEFPSYKKWPPEEDKFMLQRVEKARLPCVVPGSCHFTWGPFISHFGAREDGRLNTHSRYNSVEKTVSEILMHTPEKVDGLRALWYFFGFKKPDIFIYNTQTTKDLLENKLTYHLFTALPPWR